MGQGGLENHIEGHELYPKDNKPLKRFKKPGDTFRFVF